MSTDGWTFEDLDAEVVRLEAVIAAASDRLEVVKGLRSDKRREQKATAAALADVAPREQAAEGMSDVGGAADSGGSGAEGGGAETTQNLGATAVTLDERVQRAWAGLMENDDFEPRGAQPATMRACLERRDCIVRAATGSGKTLAGVGPLLTFAFGVLVWFTPLVELAFETKAAIEELAPTTSQYKDTQGKQRTSKTLYVRTNGARSADVLTCRGAYPVVVWTQESTAGVERGDASEADLEFYWREVYDRGAAGCLGPAAGGHEWAEEKGQVLGAIFF